MSLFDDLFSSSATPHVSQRDMIEAKIAMEKEREKLKRGSGVEKKVMNFIGNHYEEMPDFVQGKVMEKGKEKLAKEHPVVDLFCSEKTKEKLIINHLKK